MLTYFPIGPLPDGSYTVCYPTPGCSVMTVVATGMTKERAQEEAARLNEEQEKRVAAIEHERKQAGSDVVAGMLPKCKDVRS